MASFIRIVGLANFLKKRFALHRQLKRPDGFAADSKDAMAEFKFSCPQCGQHIQCDTGYFGVQINCPACQQAIVVPQAPRFAAAPSAAAGSTFGAAGPCDQAKHHGSGDGTAICRRARRSPPAKPKSKALRNVLVITASVVVLAGLGVGGWFGFRNTRNTRRRKKANPAAQVATPTANCHHSGFEHFIERCIRLTPILPA